MLVFGKIPLASGWYPMNRACKPAGKLFNPFDKSMF